ncbi:MAG TPA: hypothetical protein VFQ22_11385 [Longimicrobiales bacterium]|nr:hypothetical protein [Longimicrobiales bacterium]
MDHVLGELRRSLRVLRKERTFSATVLVTLALCLGANVAIFGVVHAVLLEPLPYRAPERLVTVFNSYPNAGAVRGSNGTVDFFERRERIAAFEEVALYDETSATVGEAGSPERVEIVRVTPSFFPLLGSRPRSAGRSWKRRWIRATSARRCSRTPPGSSGAEAHPT